MPSTMKLYVWYLRYGMACALASNVKEARKLVLEGGVDSYDTETIKGKPNVCTTKPCAAAWFN